MAARSESEPVRSTRALWRTTMAGRFLMAFSLLSLVPGLLTGGAVLLLPALATSVALLAALGAWLQLRNLRVHALAPRRVFAAEAFHLDVVLEHVGGAFHARDLLVHHGVPRNAGALPAGHAGSLAPHSSVVVPTRMRLRERGRFRSHPLVVVSSFPLGLIEHARAYELPCDFLVLPRLGQLGQLPPELARRRGELSASARRSGHEEPWALRDWRPGEARSHVHWKLSARHRRLLVREMRGEERAPFHVVLLAWSREDSGRRRHVAFEEAVSLSATLCDHFLRQGARVTLSISCAEPRRIEASRARAGLLGALCELALVRRTPPPAVGARMPEVVPQAREKNETRVVVYAGASHPAELPLPTPSPELILIDVDERETGALFQRGGLPMGEQRERLGGASQAEELLHV